MALGQKRYRLKPGQKLGPEECRFPPIHDQPGAGDYGAVSQGGERFSFSRPRRRWAIFLLVIIALTFASAALVR